MFLVFSLHLPPLLLVFLTLFLWIPSLLSVIKLSIEFLGGLRKLLPLLFIFILAVHIYIGCLLLLLGLLYLRFLLICRGHCLGMLDIIMVLIIVVGFEVRTEHVIRIFCRGDEHFAVVGVES